MQGGTHANGGEALREWICRCVLLFREIQVQLIAHSALMVRADPASPMKTLLEVTFLCLGSKRDHLAFGSRCASIRVKVFPAKGQELLKGSEGDY